MSPIAGEKTSEMFRWVAYESVRTSVIASVRGRNGSLIQSFLDAFHWTSRRNGEVSVGQESTVNFPSRLALYCEHAPIILLKRRW